MNVQGPTNSPAFGNRVIIKKGEIASLGKEALEAAEKAKNFLTNSGKDMKYTISRFHSFNQNTVGSDFTRHKLVPTNQIIVTAEKLNVKWTDKIKNLFVINLGQSSRTSAYTEEGLLKAARAAENKALDSNGIDLLKMAGDSLEPAKKFFQKLFKA